MPGSAVCSFRIKDIRKALFGRFKQDRTNGIGGSEGPSEDRHPASCPVDGFSDTELQFLKSHPLLEDQAEGRLLTTHVGERWSTVSVDPRAGPKRDWTVIFVGTFKGEIIRYLYPSDGVRNTVMLSKHEVYDPSE